MGSDSKGLGTVLGGAAGAVFGGGNPAAISAGMAIGGGVGGLLSPSESYKGPTLPKLDKNLIDNLAAQASGDMVTPGELQLKAQMDKSLANQLALLRSQKQRNPALQAKQIARAAAEQAQNAVAQNAVVAAQERQNAYQRYLQAMQYNAGIDSQNYAMTQAWQNKEDQKKGAAWNAIAQGAALGAQAYDVKGKVDASTAKPVSTPTPSSYNINDFGNTMKQAPQQQYDLNAPYTMGLTSDERQKDLIKAETVDGTATPLTMQNKLNAAANLIQSPQMPGMPASKTAEAVPQAGIASNGLSGDALKNANIAAAQQSLGKGLDFADLQYQTPGTNYGNELDPKLKADAQAKYLDFYRKNAKYASQSDARKAEIDKEAQQRLAEKGDAGLYAFHATGLDIGGKEFWDSLYNPYMAQQQALHANQNQQLDVVNKGIDAERAARAAQYYTGNAATTANDLAQVYANRQAYQNWLKQNNVVSDENAKNNVKPASPTMKDKQSQVKQVNESVRDSEAKNKSDGFNPKDFLSKLQAVSFEYKPQAQNMPGVSPGRKLGVLAQDVEKAGPVGASMVKTDPSTGTKMLDIPTGFGAVLASAAQLNERLTALEKRYGKKKEA